MKRPKILRSNFGYLVVFLLSLIIWIFGIFFIIVFNSNSHSDSLKIETLRAEEHYRSVLNEVFVKINSIEVFTESIHPDRITQERFDEFLLNSDNHKFTLINSSIAIDGIQTYVFPLIGNESVIGVDLINNDRDYVKDAVNEAIQTGLIIINGPYELRQGGYGIVFRKATFMDDEFYAIVNIVVDYKELEENLNAFNSNIVGVGVFDSSNELIFGTVPYENAQENLHGIDSQNVSWKISVIEIEDYYRSYIANTIVVVSLTTILYAFFIIAGVRLYSKERKHVKELFKMINYDNLTFLPNRSMMKIQINELIDKNIPFYLGFGDLDNFKIINDILGHSIGDEYLKEISDRFSKITNDKLEIYRWGGDEFIFIYISDNYKETLEILKKIYQITNEPIIINDTNYRISMSMGIVKFPIDGLDMDSLIKKADIVMYDIKDKEKNTYKFFENRFQESIEKQADFEKLIQNFSIVDIKLFLQPIIDVESNEIIGFEGLSRLFDIDNKIINTEEFIKYYERNGQIRELDVNTFEHACKYSNILKDMFGKDYIISFNISPISLSNALLMKFKNLIKKYKVDANNFIIEIIETAGFKDMDESLNDLQSLRMTGFKIAMDDFGKGYSSLSYITQLPLNYIKIDRSFIENYETNEFDKLIILTIKELSKPLNLKIIVEGIETQKQLDFIKEVRCDFYQGYFHSKPMSFENIIKLLKGKQ